MQAITLSFNAIFPLLAFMVIGYFLKNRGFFNGNAASEINKLVFKVFLPLSIFENIYNTDLQGSFDMKITIFVLATGIAAYVLLDWLIPKLEKDTSIIPVMVQGIHKSNYNLLAIPIVSTFVTGDIGMTAVLTAIITPLVNTCSTMIFEKYSDKNSSGMQKLVKILKNPLVLSSILGVAANLLHVPLPKVVISSVVKKLASMATPAALLSLGATFNFSRLNAYKKQLAIISVGKLILQPLVIIGLAVAFGIRGADLIAIVIFSGSPTAVNSYSTAVSMGGNEELAAQTVIFTSCLSILTLFGILCGIGLMGWI